MMEAAMDDTRRFERWIGRREHVQELCAFFSENNADGIALVASIVAIIVAMVCAWQ